MTIPLQRVAGMFYNRPLALSVDALDVISGVLLNAIDARAGRGGDGEQAGQQLTAFRSIERGDGVVEFHTPRANRFEGEYRTGDDGRPLPYRMTAKGTAIVSIMGETVNRGAWIGSSSGLVSYEGLRHQFTAAGRDPKVRGILADFETPGGEVIGCFETADLIRQIAATKPVFGVSNGIACSAGYALLSACSRAISIPSGRTGSIGIYLLHLDISQYLAASGVKPTLVWAGAHKVDGSQFQPLPDDVRARFQAQVDTSYEAFIACVARGRKMLTPEAIRSTEALVYSGDDALRLGLIDELATLDDALQQLEKGYSITATTHTASPAMSSHGAKATNNVTTKETGTMDPNSITDTAGTTPDLNAQHEALKRQNEALRARLDGEARTRISAEVEAFRMPLLAKGDLRFNAQTVAGLGNLLLVGKAAAAGLTAIGIGEREVALDAASLGAYVTEQVSLLANAGAKFTPQAGQQFDNPAEMGRAQGGVSLDDIRIAASNVDAGKRVQAAITARRATTPGFTIHDLERELRGAAR